MLWFSYFAMFLLMMVGVIMIFIILLQRGRGGGLAGALGGMGGQSAFGTKAGDMFTRITVVLALIWIVLCAGQIPLLRAVAKRYTGGGAAADVLESAPLKSAGANPKVDVPQGNEDQVDLKAENDASEPADAKSSVVGDENRAEQPAEKPAPEKPADAASNEPAAEKPASESESKSEAEQEQQP